MISHSNPSKVGVHRSALVMSDADIAFKYLGIDHVPCLASSPLREDKNPSMSFFLKDNRIFWKDFGTGEGGTLLHLLCLLWKVNFREALEKIESGTGTTYTLKCKRRYSKKSTSDGRTYLKVKTRNWDLDDLRYWRQFGIQKDMLEKCNVCPISHYFFEDDVAIRADKLAYAYFEWKDGHESIKVYQPLSTTAKWLTNRDRSVWDLWTQAMDCKNKSELIITSSRKDAMCIWSCLGIPAVCMQGEGYTPKESVMRELLSKFGTVYIWYDSDEAGISNAKLLCDKYPLLNNICIPTYYHAKDPSDFVKKYGPNCLTYLYNQKKLQVKYD